MEKDNINDLIDTIGEEKEGSVISTEVEPDDISKLKKAFDKKAAKVAIAASLIGTLVLLLIIAAILGGVFGAAASYAKKSIKFDTDYAKVTSLSLAKEVLKNKPGVTEGMHADIDMMRVKKVSYDLDTKNPLQSSKYYYEVELKTPSGIEVTVKVDTKTGRAEIEDIDYD